MATIYVRSAAGGANNGTSWTNAYPKVTSFSPVSGDVVYVAADHNESTAGTITVGNTGTVANPVRWICAEHTGSVPPVVADLRTTAQVKTTGNGTIQIQGVNEFVGIIFSAGDSTGIGGISVCQTGNQSDRFTNCSLRIGGSATTPTINLGTGNAFAFVELRNTTVSFANASQKILMSGRIIWRDTASAVLGTIPTTLFLAHSTGYGWGLECAGIDLSAMGSGKTLVSVASTIYGNARFVDCKIDTAVTKIGSMGNIGGHDIDFVRCGSSGLNYTLNRTRYNGVLDEETTIVRTGGASDGTTPIAWKIVTTANCSWFFPFECPPIAIWNDTTGSAKTATVEGIWGGGAVPNDDEIWVDVEYLGSSSSPQGSFVNDSKATILTTAAGQASSSETWGGSTTKFKLGVTFTAQQKGWIYARVKCAKVSSTFYVDPLVTLT